MYKKLLCLSVILSLSVTVAWSQEAELVHLWQFDGDVEDASGSGNHGVIDGGGATYAPGPFGQAISLGAGVGVTNTAPSNLPIGATDTWSMNIWLNLDETPANLAWLAGFGGRPVHAGDGSKRAYLQFDAGYYFWGHSRDVDSGQAYATDGIWHMYTITYDATEIAMYFDGHEVKRQATTLVDTQAVVGVGGTSNWNADLAGKYDDFSIWRGVLSVDDIDRLMSEPTLGPPTLASAPSPEEDSTDVSRDVILAWTPGEFAVTHDVYLGTVFDDVNDAGRADDMGLLFSQGQTAVTYDPEGVFEYGQTYYWRIDEVNGAPDNTIFRGETWSFTVEPLAYPIENIIATSNGTPQADANPENVVNGSGLNENDEHSTASPDMWLASPLGDEPLTIEFEFDGVYKLHEMLLWNYNVQFELLLGFGVKDTTIEYSKNGTDWTLLGDVQLAQGTATSDYVVNTTIDFAGVAAQHVKITVNSGYGMMGQFGLSEVRFLHIPVQAREPQPEDGATDVSVSGVLSWRAGREAVSHEAYLSTDPDALALIDTTSETTVDPGALDLATTYYWRIDEVNEAEAISTWQGTIWSLSTEAFIVVDDFESYDDEDNRIYDAWVDGYGVSSNGSTVGHLDSPFAEQTIVKGGNQSMPLFYDNAGTSMSEAEFTLAQNWSSSGIQSLSLSFHGDAANSGGQLYVKINSTKILYDGSATNLTKATWNLWSIDLSTAGNVSSVSSLTIGIEGAGASGVLYIDDVRLHPEVLAYHKFPDITAAGDIVQGVPNDDDWPAAESPDLAVDDDVNTKYLHRKGGAMATGIQITPAAGATIVTGLTLTTANDSPGRDPITFDLSGSNAGIDGPYTLIAAGDVVDFAGEAEWPRFAKNETLITFENNVAYTHYQIVFPTLRDEGEALMQIAEVELIGSAP